MRCDAMRCDAMRCDAMRCDAMRCDAMRCDAMRCDAMRCDAMRCDAMRCDAMRCDAMRCDAMRCDAMRCAMRCDAMQCDAIRCNSMQFDAIQSKKALLCLRRRTQTILVNRGYALTSRKALKSREASEVMSSIFSLVKMAEYNWTWWTGQQKMTDLSNISLCHLSLPNCLGSVLTQQLAVSSQCVMPLGLLARC